ncbi:hypothetical protein B0J14DRAFT_316038 [Halenospora varia]|nr:hypothetical protein B0J14DRAFT_316038 [Halenospora varia]
MITPRLSLTPSSGMMAFIMGGPFLLDLPFEARSKIYSYLGLIRSCPIDITLDLVTFDPGLSLDLGYGSGWECRHHMKIHGSCNHGRNRVQECACQELPTSLLYLHRDITAEVIDIFYSRNEFVLRAHTGVDLTCLKSMGVRALAAMTSLLVRLNSWPCPRGHASLSLDGSKCATCQKPVSACDPTLDSSDEAGQDVIQKWHEACKHMSTGITPGKLKLTFICDVANFESATNIIQALSMLPTLKECSIRLGRKNNHELQAFSRTTSALMINAVQPRTSFPFNHLPPELRLRILSFTDLVSQDVCHKNFNRLVIRNGKLLKSNAINANAMLCCSVCTNTGIDCCCPSLYAASSASCRCRIIPFELFLVSKQMYNHATEVLYSQNIFEFKQDAEETFAFLNDIPRTSLKQIRQVEFSFLVGPPVTMKACFTAKSWRRLMRFIKIHFNIPRLSFRITIDAYDTCLWNDEENEEENRYVYDMYCDIVRGLRILDGLEDVRFELDWLTDLAPFLEWEVLGERAKERLPEDPQSRPFRNFERHNRIPIWYNLKSNTSGIDEIVEAA